jgi:pimeloyl-ACP methyl ester carboxylesterase
LRRAATALLLAAGLAHGSASAAGPLAITTVHPVQHPVGLMVTSGGWAYCEQLRRLARRTRYTLLCGRYAKDGYLGPGLRAQRHLDWGNPVYLTSFARAIKRTHARVGGKLVLVGVSYSGFGVATLASHHPELRPDRLIVIDSYLDLVARRARLPDAHQTAREIDGEVASATGLRRRSVTVDGLARLVREGTRLTVVWSVSEDERREFRGATCSRAANAQTLQRLARRLDRPVPAWVTHARHGHDLWNHGVDVLQGHEPGRRVVFRPAGRIPAWAVCPATP